MANKLTFAQMTTLLAKTGSAMTPGDIDDLKAALKSVNAPRGSDSNRSIEVTLGTTFATRVG